MKRTQIICLVLSIASQPLRLGAQNPGQRIVLQVEPRSITIRGDTVGVVAAVTNLATSQESLLSYLVDAPSGIVSINRPNPTARWYASTDFRDRPMAVWDILGQQLTPGETSPDLYFESIGVPGILTYWAGGKFPRSNNEDLPDSVLVTDPLVTEMISGKTVGVSPWPIDRTPGGLLSRLRSLTQSSCTTPLLWITDSNLCGQLTNDVDQAEGYRANGQMTEARAVLDHFASLLSGSVAGTFATGVTGSGYWLLKPNSEIIKNML
jgi:hypothetical protein